MAAEVVQFQIRSRLWPNVRDELNEMVRDVIHQCSWSGSSPVPLQVSNSVNFGGGHDYSLRSLKAFQRQLPAAEQATFEQVLAEHLTARTSKFFTVTRENETIWIDLTESYRNQIIYGLAMPSSDHIVECFKRTRQLFEKACRFVAVAKELAQEAQEYEQFVGNDPDPNEALELQTMDPVTFIAQAYETSAGVHGYTTRQLLTSVARDPLTILVDFSSPNIAKELHVGHLRSTIIGDAICRLFESQGHNVLRINHIGDYGLQFGMIVEYMLRDPELSIVSKLDGLTIEHLQAIYVASKKCFDSDSAFNKAAHIRLVELQSANGGAVGNGAPAIIIWQRIKAVSKQSYDSIYQRLGVRLDEVGESFYQSMIPSLITELKAKGLLGEEDGRQIIRIHGHSLPLTVVKSDGGYTYDTTDLAALRYRLQTLKADALYYVVDISQSVHFELLFAAAKLAGWLQTHQTVKHVGFGMVLGPDHKKIKSREGGAIKLNHLLDEAVNHATDVITQMPQGSLRTDKLQKRLEAIPKIAYSSLKYIDLMSDRCKNYVFSYDRMLSLTSNSGVYQLYAYTRINSILQMAGAQHCQKAHNMPLADFVISDPAEKALCQQLVRLPEVIQQVTENLQLNQLCNYLYDLAEAFHKFHNECRCLTFERTDVPGNELILTGANYSRLRLCIATLNVMGHCFDILGLDRLEWM